MAANVYPDSDIYHDYAHTVLKMYHDDLRLKDALPPGSKIFSPDVQLRPITRIAIVGAGVAGLSAAMKLNDSKVPYEIDVYESNERIGGRLYTHHFKDAPAGDYDYFDVGAMRFPDIPSMKPTFDLFTRLGIKTQKYYRTQENNVLLYNNQRRRRRSINNESWRDDPFHVTAKNGGSVPDEYAREPPQHWYDQAIKPLVKEYHDLVEEDPKTAMSKIIKKYDHYSIRGYMAHHMGYPTEVINWIETMNSGTSWFDRGLMQAILEGVAFTKAPDDIGDTVWSCVDGGADVLSTAMENYLKNQKNTRVSIHTQHHVTAIKFLDRWDLEVCGSNQTEGSFSRKYSHVILAIPPSCIRALDLSTCELDFGQRNGLRELEVAPSSKIGIKFKTAWWKEQGITGGQSQTDRLARTIVYPSHGGGESTVLIASYVWTQDSLVLGALMQGQGSLEEKRLKDIILADLADVHDIPLSRLETEFESMYAFDWSNNALSMGAFGIFGPGQWGRYYRSLSRPAAKEQLYFVGETFSSIHGWVAGALNSATNAVFEILTQHKWACEQSKEPITYPSPLDTFKIEWKLEFPEDEEDLELQLAASLKLQKEEYHY